MPEYEIGTLTINLNKVEVTEEQARTLCEALHGLVEENFSSEGDYYMMTFQKIVSRTGSE